MLQSNILEPVLAIPSSVWSPAQLTDACSTGQNYHWWEVIWGQVSLEAVRGIEQGADRLRPSVKKGTQRVGAARKRGGRITEKMILVTWQFWQRSCWCGKVLYFWIKIHLVWKATHLSLPEPCPFPPRIQIWEPGICRATSLCFYLICFLFPLGGRERRINMAEKINTG